MITQEAKVISIPNISNEKCIYDYTVTFEDPLLEGLAVYSGETNTLTAWSDQKDALPVGASEPCPVTVTATDPLTGQVLTTTFILTILNPCYDPEYLIFPQPVDMADLYQYYLYQFPEGGLTVNSNTLLTVEIVPNG